MRNGFPIFECDVVTAFMHADETGDVWTDPPVGYARDDLVWLHRKCVNGRRIASRNFQELLAPKLIERGFTTLASHPSVFIHVQKRIYIVIHVDDFHVAGPEKEIREFFAAFEDDVLIKLSDPVYPGQETNFLGRKKLYDHDGITTLP